MNYTFATEINAPRERVAELAGNLENRKHWMDGLESDEHLSGTPGAPFSVASYAPSAPISRAVAVRSLSSISHA